MRRRSAAALVLTCVFAGASCKKSEAPTPSPTPAPEPTPVASTIRFEDVTDSAGVSFTHVNGAFGKKWMPETMGSGVAAFDADGDGLTDLLFVNSRHWNEDPRPRRDAPTLAFYRNVTPPGGALRFEDATKASGLGVSLYGMGAAVADVNADGAPDLLVTALSGNRLFLNDGKGRFRDATKGSGVEGGGWTTSAAFADFDGDGVLDVFICEYVKWTPETDLFCTLDGTRKAYCTPERYPGTTSRLYKGLGAGRFRETTKEAGVVNPLGKALGVAVRDIDGDSRLDIAVANDTAPNNLFKNLRTEDGIPRFQDVAVEQGIAVGEDGRARGAMGIAFGDTKNDGGTSLVVGNFSNEMWSFWSAGPKGDFFVDEAFVSGVGRTSLLPLTFGVAFADFDLDGVLDIVGTNGHVESSVQEVQPATTYAQPPLLFRGVGGGRFADVTAQAGASFGRPIVGRGLAVADLDGDGKPDLVMTTNGGKACIYRNTTPTPNRAVELDLGNAIGARVTSRLPAGTRADEVSGGDGYLSVSERIVRIGIGAAPALPAVSVRWPDGQTGEAKDLAPGRYLWKPGDPPVTRTRTSTPR
jgi:enediyne biosynthesis protein E4